MRYVALFPAVLAALATPIWAEVWVSSTPLAPARLPEAPAAYHLTEIRLAIDPPAVVIRVEARRADGVCARDARDDCQTVVARYEGDEARALLNVLNSANLASRSLVRRVLERLQADGHLPAGAIAGAAGVATTTPTASATPTGSATETPTQAPTEPTATMTATPTPGAAERSQGAPAP